MTAETLNLLDRALSLPREERGALVAELLRSFDAADHELQSDEAWEAAWADELQRRVRDAREHPERLLDGEEVLERLRQRFEPS